MRAVKVNNKVSFPLFRGLTKTQMKLIDSASLEIMERTGMRFYSREAIDLFKKAGACVSDGNLVRIPSRLVDKALATVPKQIIIYDRLGAQAMTLGEQNTYFGVGSDCMNIWDVYTNKRRKAIYQDMINGVRVADYLPNIDFIMSMYLPSDVNQQIYDRYQMQAMLLESKKPHCFG